VPDDAVNEDNGCIYLGILSDLTVGPFAPLGVQIVEGQRAFWQRVNEDGGIGGYDVDIDTYTRDNEYDPQVHVAATARSSPTSSRSPRRSAPRRPRRSCRTWTPTTSSASRRRGGPAGSFEESDNGLILESGYSYCIESQIGLDWSTRTRARSAPSRPSATPVTTAATPRPARGVGRGQRRRVRRLRRDRPERLVGSQDAAVGQVVSGPARTWSSSRRVRPRPPRSSVAPSRRASRASSWARSRPGTRRCWTRRPRRRSRRPHARRSVGGLRPASPRRTRPCRRPSARVSCRATTASPSAGSGPTR
jgi:hypothetical protein